MKKIEKTPVNIKLRSFWAVVFTMLAFVLLVLPATAQQIRIGSGTHFVNGTKIVVNGDGIVNQGTIKNKATGVIKLTGNWQNHGTCSSEKGSVVTLAGSATQVIGGSNPTTFGTLNLNNSAGFSLAQHTTVNGRLDFQNGMLTTNNYLVTIGDTGTITNATSTKYVDGKLAMTFSSLGTKPFPIGKGGNYRPVTLQFTGLTGTSIVTAEQFETGLSGTLPGDITLLTSDRQWTISQTGGSNLQYLLSLDATGYTPVYSVLMLKEQAGSIQAFPTASPDYTNADALSAFGNFALGECIPPSVTNQSTAAQTKCAGETFDAITVTAIGAGLNYQWYSNTSASTSGVEVANLGSAHGAQSDTYTPQTATAGTLYYYCVVTGTCGTATSAVSGRFLLYPAFTAGAISTAGQTICYDGNPSVIGNSTDAGGGDGTITYRWQSSLNAGFTGTPTDISSNSLTYDPPSGLHSTTWYRRQAHDGTCNTGWNTSTGVWRVTVIPKLTAGVAGSSQTICYNTAPVQLTSTPANGGTLPYAYQWQGSPDNINFQDVNGATGAAYQPGGLTATTWYRLLQTSSGGCGTVATGSVAVTVHSKTISASATFSSVCSGSPTTIYAAGGANYLWDHGLGAGSSKVVNPAEPTTYTVSATDNYGCQGQTASVSVNVTSLPPVQMAGSAPGATSGSSYISAGSSESLTAGGATTYLWSTGSTASQIQVSPTATAVYTVTGSTGICSASASHTVNVASVNAGPNQSVCYGNSATLSAISSGIPSPVYVWTPGNLTGAAITVTPLVNKVYTVTINGTYTSMVTVFVRIQPGVEAGPNITIGPGGTGTLSGSVTIPTVAPYAYAWTTSGGSIVGGGNTATPTVAAAGTYTVAVTDGNGCASISDFALVTMVSGGSTVTGNIAYAFNTVNNQMHDVIVTLKQGNVTKYTASTPATGNGNYQFLNVVSGDYTVYLSSAKPWGGVTSADIVLIQNHYKPVGAVPLTGIKRLAADVVDNGASAIVIASDRDLINNRRLTPTGYSFLTGDWVFTKAGDISANPYPAGVICYANSLGSTITLTVSGSAVSQDFRALCYGDVDASNTGCKDNENSISNVITSTSLGLTNFPNPFTDRTTIQFTVPVKGKAKVEIRTLPGVLVGTINDPDDYEGVHNLFFDRDKLAPGLYLYTVRVTTSDDIFIETEKMIIIN